MKKSAQKYFYEVIINNAGANVRLATFETLDEVSAFIVNNANTLVIPSLNNVKVYKYSYGYHQNNYCEEFLYKFDRIIGTYFLVGYKIK